MQRRTIAQRPNWKERVEEQGLLFHSVEKEIRQTSGGYRDASTVVGTEIEEVAYWAEGTYYAFASAEIDAIEAATNELQERFLEAGQHIIDKKRYRELGIPDVAVPLIERSWEEEPPAIYGRMDLVMTDSGKIKLLEYNADTPTSLLEAAVIQWTWLEDMNSTSSPYGQEWFGSRDQFNSIHEKLVAKWTELRGYLRREGIGRHLPSALSKPMLHFAHVDSLEDLMTVTYLRDTAEQGGIKTAPIRIEDIGWNGKVFTDKAEKPILNLFKLYPWEWLFLDSFGQNIRLVPDMFWIEPAWKMLFSTKGILPILWELFPGHPNLLPAFFTPDRFATSGYVKKPLHGREGANVEIIAADTDHTVARNDGPYAGQRCIYQEYVEIPSFDGFRPVLGSWVIDGVSAGMGIRETFGHITDNTARFVPHTF